MAAVMGGLHMKKTITLFIALLFTGFSFLFFPVIAEGYDCEAGNHNDVIISYTDDTVTYQCDLCGRQYVDNLPGDGHLWSDWIIEENATCTTAGRRYRTCLLHSPHNDYEQIPATGHDYELTIKQPTCTSKGLKIYICSHCGDNYSEMFGEIKKHNYEESIIKEPNCEIKGEKVFVCEDCGDIRTENIPALKHEYGDWIIDKQAAEGVAGMQHKECVHGCGEIIEETISPLPVSQTSSLPDVPKVEQEEGDEPFFNKADVIIYSTNIVLIATFLIILKPLGSAINWEKRKRKEYLAELEKKRKEIKRHDYS